MKEKGLNLMGFEPFIASEEKEEFTERVTGRKQEQQQQQKVAADGRKSVYFIYFLFFF